MYEPRTHTTWTLQICPGTEDSAWASWALIEWHWRGSEKRGSIVTRGSLEVPTGILTERTVWEALGDVVGPHLPTAMY